MYITPCNANAVINAYEAGKKKHPLPAEKTLKKAIYQKTSAFFLEIETEPRIRPYTLTVKEKQNRDRNKRQGDESQQRVTPAQAKCVVHFQARKREHSAEEGAQDCVCGDGTSGVDGEGVDEIGLNRHHGCEVSDAYERCAYDGYDPVHAVRGGPAVHEYANGHADCARESEDKRETVLGRNDVALSLVFFNQLVRHDS